VLYGSRALKRIMVLTRAVAMASVYMRAEQNPVRHPRLFHLPTTPFLEVSPP